MSAIEKLGLQKNNEVSKNGYSDTQEQTKDIFGFKWKKRDSYEDGGMENYVQKWLIERYANGDVSNLDKILGEDGKIIIDAGCGSGFSALLLFGDKLNKHDYLGIDISSAVNVAADRFKEKGVKGEFLQMSILDIPVADNSVDIIFSEGVLHHTDSTEKAIKYLASKIKPGGVFMFYIYAKKSAAREFTDDYVREQIREMTDEEAWEAMKPLTKLGIKLGELNVKINIEEDIPVLGIKKGEMDLQRFLYWNFCKTYYRPEYSFEEMNHINFDWFRPLNCHRQTPEETTKWCNEASLDIEDMVIEDAGFTVIARKK
ncbi:class I SAM-dependent methyltransferase [soil metagenome]